MTWQGVIIEESLENKQLLRLAKIVRSRKGTLESEPDREALRFHMVEIDDQKKNTFVQKAEQLISQGWYLHLCNNGTMIVVFKNKVFEFTVRDRKDLEAARHHGITLGIPEEQMEFERLIKNPFD